MSDGNSFNWLLFNHLKRDDLKAVFSTLYQLKKIKKHKKNACKQTVRVNKAMLTL